MQQLQPHALADWLERAGQEGTADPAPLVLDVREDWEAQICMIPGSLHVPMQQIVGRLGEIEGAHAVVCVCHHGMRSMQVAMFLERRGAPRVYNLLGGIDAWARQVDPSCALY